MFQLSNKRSINKDHSRHFFFRPPTVRQSVTWTKLVRLWSCELASHHQKAAWLMGEIQIRISRLADSLFSHLSLFLLFLVNRTKLQWQKKKIVLMFAFTRASFDPRAQNYIVTKLLPAITERYQTNLKPATSINEIGTYGDLILINQPLLYVQYFCLCLPRSEIDCDWLEGVHYVCLTWS